MHGLVFSWFLSDGNHVRLYTWTDSGTGHDALELCSYPLLFISGVYIPVSELPFWGQVVSLLSPLTHTIELARYAIGGETFFGLIPNVIILAAYTAVFLFMGIRFHTMNQRKE